MAELKKRLGYSAITTLLQVYTGVAVIFVLARFLALEQFGGFVFGLSLAGIVGACGEFGYSLMTSRDIPQNRFDLPSYVADVLFQKTVISGFVAIVGILYLRCVLGNAGQVFWINCWFLLHGTLLSYSMYFTALLQAMGRFNQASHAMVLNAVLVTVVVALLVFGQLNYTALCVLFVAAHGGRLAWLIWALRDVVSFRRPDFRGDIQQYLIKNSWSFGLHYVVGTLCFTIDVQFIYLFLGTADVALYNSASRIATLILLLPTFLLQVFTPHLSAEYGRQGEHFQEVVKLLVKLLVYLSGAFAVVLCMFDRPALGLVYGPQYLEAAPLFAPILIMCTLRCLALVYGTLLTISDHQVFRVKVLVGSLAVSAVANLALIPACGIMGAALAAVITHLFLLGAYLHHTRMIYRQPFVQAPTLMVAGIIAACLVAKYAWPGLLWPTWMLGALVACLILATREIQGVRAVLQR